MPRRDEARAGREDLVVHADYHVGHKFTRRPYSLPRNTGAVSCPAASSSISLPAASQGGDAHILHGQHSPPSHVTIRHQRRRHHEAQPLASVINQTNPSPGTSLAYARTLSARRHPLVEAEIMPLLPTPSGRSASHHLSLSYYLMHEIGSRPRKCFDRSGTNMRESLL